MTVLVEMMLAYLAIGAACFAHPKDGAEAADFTPRGQWAVFLATLPEVLTWPMMLWR